MKGFPVGYCLIPMVYPISLLLKDSRKGKGVDNGCILSLPPSSLPHPSLWSMHMKAEGAYLEEERGHLDQRWGMGKVGRGEEEQGQSI